MKGIIILIIIVISLLSVSCDSKSKKEVLSKDVSSDVQVEVSERQQLLNKAKQLLNDKKYSGAKVYYEKAIALDKSNRDVYLQIKDDYMIEERYDDAYDIITKAINNEVDSSYMQEVLEEIKIYFPIIKIDCEVEEGKTFYPPNSTLVDVNDEEVNMKITWDEDIPTQLSAGTYSYQGYNDTYGRTFILNVMVNEKEKESNIEKQEEVPTTTTAESKTNKEEDKEIENQDKVQYSLEENSFNNENISVLYPKVTNMNNEELQNKINDNIFLKVEEITNYYQVENPTMNIKYTIKQKDNILSFVYSGYGSYDGAAYPIDFFYTTNIDMETGNVLKLSDLVTIDEEFINKLKATNTIKDSNIDNYFNTLSEEEIENKLNNSDTTNSEVQSYLTEDGDIGVSITVVHALGDHLEYEVVK